MATADPDAEVIALSPRTLLATNRFLCEICGKGFQRGQNLQLHRRGHNLPWKLRQRTSKEPRKKVYVCPEKSCIHHNPSRALGDLTGIKKHFCRKHGEKKWKCEKCAKRYAVQSDWKVHSKTCGTREYRCDCGTIFSRRDSFITHRAFCDALAAETARVYASNINNLASINTSVNYHFTNGDLMRANMVQNFPSAFKPTTMNNNAESINTAQRLGHLLWTIHGQQDIDHTMIKTNDLLDSSLHEMQPLSTPNHLPDPFALSTGGQMSWIYGHKLNTSSTGELISSTLLSNVKETDGSSHPILASIPSLYTTQLPHHQPMTSPADISATAMLQKAAQIGVTSSGPKFFGSSLEVKSQDSHELPQGCNGQFDTLLNGSHTSLASKLQSSTENAVNDHLVLSDPFSAIYSTRHRMPQKEDLIRSGRETRDFLGVGAQSMCASSINEWIWPYV